MFFTIFGKNIFYMPVPTQPNEQRIRRDSDFIWEQFAKDCLLNKYVFIVCNDATSIPKPKATA